MAGPINLTAGLSKQTRITKKGTSVQTTIRIKADELWFNPNERAVSATLARALVEQIRANLRGGRGPAGQVLPPVSASTRERREDEEAQGHNGGRPVVKVHNPDFVARAVRNYTKDYRSRLGSFTPRAGGPRGMVSGMLEKSIVARPDKSGKGFTIYVAARRGKPRDGETLSAVDTVFGPTLNQVPRFEMQLKTAAALKKAEAQMVNAKLRDLLKDALETIRDTVELSRQVEEEV